MNTPIRKTLTAVLAMAMLLATGLMTGCSDEAAGPSGQAVIAGDDYENLDFNQPNGGLTATDEDVAFGDKAFEDLLFNEDLEVSDDPMLTDPEVLSLEAMAEDPPDSNEEDRPRFTFARLEWGMIHGPIDSLDFPGDCGDLDWSGTISVDRGLLVVSRVILFEFPWDHLVRPRPDRQTVGFVSHTSCHFDGLVLKIIERAEDLDPTLPPNMLHIATGPFAGDFTLAELAGMNESFPVDDVGNTLHLTGFTLNDIVRCPKGFLNGRWRVLPVDAPVDTLLPGDPDLSVQFGTFGGPWINLSGHIVGFMRCGYGLDQEGNRVFSGKRIDRMGHFTAFVNGTWEAGPDGVSLAGFHGDWATPDNVRAGVLSATAFPFSPPGLVGGFYEGRWTTLCDPEAEDQVR